MASQLSIVRGTGGANATAPDHSFGLSILAMFVVHAASAQGTNLTKAIARATVMPADKVQKMRECQRRAEQQKISVQDHFVDDCVAAKANERESI